MNLQPFAGKLHFACSGPEDHLRSLQSEMPPAAAAATAALLLPTSDEPFAGAFRAAPRPCTSQGVLNIASARQWLKTTETESGGVSSRSSLRLSGAGLAGSSRGSFDRVEYRRNASAAGQSYIPSSGSPPRPPPPHPNHSLSPIVCF